MNEREFDEKIKLLNTPDCENFMIKQNTIKKHIVAYDIMIQFANNHQEYEEYKEKQTRLKDILDSSFYYWESLSSDFWKEFCQEYKQKYPSENYRFWLKTEQSPFISI